MKIPNLIFIYHSHGTTSFIFDTPTVKLHKIHSKISANQEKHLYESEHLFQINGYTELTTAKMRKASLILSTKIHGNNETNELQWITMNLIDTRPCILERIHVEWGSRIDTNRSGIFPRKSRPSLVELLCGNEWFARGVSRGRLTNL